MHYTYVYFDPEKSSDLHPCGFLPFYVGKGQRDRMIHHLFESNLKGERNKHKANKIRKLLKKGMKPHIEIISEFEDEDSAYALEIDLIKKWGRTDLGLGPLTNMTDGGEGARGKIFTPEYRRKLSEAAKKVKPSEETKAKISARFLGTTQSADHVAKRIASKAGYKHSEATKQKIREARQRRTSHVGSIRKTSSTSSSLL
jgi:hypothetical protein